MKNFKSLITFLLVITIQLILLTACGGGLSGTWENVDGNRVWSTFSFSGNSFAFWERGQDMRGAGESVDEYERRVEEGRTRTGTYSISRDQSGDKIELTWKDDGRIDVLDFSRTENTIEIGGRRFSRQR